MHMRWLMTVALLSGCGFSPTVGPSATPPPYDELAENPVGIFVESPITRPLAGPEGTPVGMIGHYTVSPGDELQMVGRTTDGSPVTWSIPGVENNASIDASGRLRVNGPGRIGVVAATPANQDRIASIVFASVDPRLSDARIELPAQAKLVGPQPQVVNKFERGLKVFLVTNQTDWAEFWGSGIDFPHSPAPALPSVNFVTEAVLVMRYYRQPDERDPVVTQVTSGDEPTVEVIVPSKSNWRVVDPVRGPDMPAHLLLYRLPKEEVLRARFNLHTDRLDATRPLPHYNRGIVTQERPPAVPVSVI
jgi:hypothetical protein